MNNRYNLNKNLAQMLKGGVIMDVTNVELVMYMNMENFLLLILQLVVLPLLLMLP